MKEQPVREGGLASAHARLAGLLEELNDTVDLVDRLTRLGEHGEAVRMVEQQREALYEAIDSISRDVAKRSPGWRETARRNVTTMVAAAALVLSSLAVSFAAMRQSPMERATAGIAKAREVADPAERLKIIREVVEIIKTQPAAADSDVARALPGIIDDTKKDIENDGPSGDEDLMEEADRLAEEANNIAPPGVTPPSQDQGPLEDVNGILEGPAPAPPTG